VHSVIDVLKEWRHEEGGQSNQACPHWPVAVGDLTVAFKLPAYATFMEDEA
jgi:hypothetical protein